MKLEYGRDGIPAMVIEKPDARIRITFNETPTKTDLKRDIFELLSAACADNAKVKN